MGLNINILVFMFLSGLLFSMAETINPTVCQKKEPVHEYNFTLTESNFTNHCVTKPMLTVNGRLPGPEIRARIGHTVRVNVHNLGNYPVTIHWHGVKNPRNPWHDGPEYITQCPIQNGSSFSQDVILSDEVGTLWWHAHSDWSRATVHGPLVVLPHLNLYPLHIHFDCEETIVLGSWYNGNVAEQSEKASNYLQPDESNAHTINGYIGKFSTNCSDDRNTFNMTVDKGKTYLLRIVNAVMNEEMFFTIANHTLRVVGMDGAYVEPISSTYIMLAPGNTMDVLVTADQNASFYSMAAGPYANSAVAPFDPTIAIALLKYSGSYDPPSSHPIPDTLPGRNDTAKGASFMKSLRNAENTIIPFAQVHYNMTIGIETNNTSGTRFASLSDITFQANSNTTLLEAYSRCQNCSSTDAYTTNFPHQPYTKRINGTEVISVEWGTVVEIVFQGSNTSGVEDHPMHLHGHSFYLVGIGFNETFKNVSTSYNLKPPPLLNTVAVPIRGWAAIRFVADNPGVWFIHCHLERHASWGMSTALIVKNSKKLFGPKLHSPPLDMPRC